MLGACMGTRAPAPVSERTPPGQQRAPQAAVAKPAPVAKPAVAEARAELYTVKPGDTVYSIALEHGLDYRELAIWNGIDNPGALRVGKQLRLTAPASAVTTAPLRMPVGTVHAKPLGSAPIPAPATAAVPAYGQP